MPRSPAIEDTFIIPDLHFLVLSLPINLEHITAADMQFTLMSLTIYWWLCFVANPIKAVPTLFMRRQISKFSNCFIISSTFVSSWESSKLNTIVLNWDVIDSFFWILWRYSTVLLSFSWFRDMRMILIPWEASTLQKPSPIPSVAPVTIAQLSFSPLQYLFLRLGYGSKYLMIAHRVKNISLMIGYPNSMMNMKSQLNSSDK